MPARTPYFGLFLVLIFSSFCSGQSKETLIWTGESGGFSIRWTDQDISVRSLKNSSAVMFSTKKLQEQDRAAYFQSMKEMEEPDEQFPAEDNCDFGTNHRLFSVVGSILTFEYSQFTACRFAAHPDIQFRLTSLDLNKKGEVVFEQGEIDEANRGKEVFLNDLFPEKEILQALLQDKIIKKELQKGNGSIPSTLTELQTTLSEPVGADIGTENCDYDFPKDFLSRFAFYDVQGNIALVRISLPNGAGYCADRQLMLTIRLNIPEQLKSAFVDAAQKNHGFLMKDVGKFHKSAASDLVYEIAE
jgi:hypothetical protein